MNKGYEAPAQLEFTILGCGSSGGVPRIGGDWGKCDPGEQKNRRRRCALLVRLIKPNIAPTCILVDSGPDLRQQLLDSHVNHLDGIIYTHAHADHLHGIDDLRVLAITERRRLDVYMDQGTWAHALHAFGYCFEQVPGSSYPPILIRHEIADRKPFSIKGASGPLPITPLSVNHGEIDALGFRFHDLVYLPDVKHIPEEVLKEFQNLDVLIIDALRPIPHPSHFSLDDALSAIALIKPRRAILTNMHVDMDYAHLRNVLPPNVEPAYDGMKIVCSSKKN